MRRYSACIEMLFVAETPVFADRIRMAADAGFDGFEFWTSTDKDIPAIERAMSATGLPLAGILAEPKLNLTDPASHDAWVAGVKRSAALATRLGARVMIATTGDIDPFRPRPQQRAALVRALSQAAEVIDRSGLLLALEPLNTLVDHPGYFLDRTDEGLDIVDEISSPNLRLLMDLYHSGVMGEDARVLLAGRTGLVGHVHIADHPGRGPVGSGGLAVPAQMDWLEAQGYTGWFGMEFRPVAGTLAALAGQGLPLNASKD